MAHRFLGIAMPRPQFTLRALLVLLLAVACWFGGIRFERERYAREMDGLRQLIIETVVAGDEILPDDRPAEDDD
jgi:hypothetical protein